MGEKSMLLAEIRKALLDPRLFTFTAKCIAIFTTLALATTAAAWQRTRSLHYALTFLYAFGDLSNALLLCVSLVSLYCWVFGYTLDRLLRVLCRWRSRPCYWLLEHGSVVQWLTTRVVEPTVNYGIPIGYFQIFGLLLTMMTVYYA